MTEDRWPFIHHIGVFVSDYDASLRFYSAALEPLGVIAAGEAEGGVEFWEKDRDTPSIGIAPVQGDDPVTRGVHIGFTAADRAAVDAFYEAALAAGGVSRHAPRLWPDYRAYCAFVSDPDGNNIEALHKETT
ncbi:VOC family protein [Streptomyces sp. A7024]|uniref:VOC family protein n=1 Tax=Streptomyces coryli TaxID=1128680 RepID=A0A6G4U2B5_9ACTN|nr:VOC family protein [Streptomyces coryli]NGN65427.1 VOC family protein [Streptomyces coryli]